MKVTYDELQNKSVEIFDKLCKEVPNNQQKVVVANMVKDIAMAYFSTDFSNFVKESGEKL